MSKTKLLTLSVIILTLLNLGLLIFLFSHGGKKRPMPREIIIEKLHFDDSQIVAYDKIIKEHQQAIRTLDKSIRETKNEAYSHLNDATVDENTKNRLLNKIAVYQAKIETTHFNHFMEIKAICKPDQLEDFKNLTTELSKIFGHPPGPKK
ncbi:hypothetical protein [Flavobacterium pedocola]